MKYQFSYRGDVYMPKQTFIVSFLLSVSLFIASPAFAKRIALIIGNDDYTNVSKLQKAVNDATAVASTLEDTGFQILLEKNADRQSMNRLLGKLSAKIEVGDEVLFYFSGHGVAVRGENYLLPTDIPPIVPNLEHSISKEAFSEDEIISLMKERGAKVSIMIIDACRNNPFPKGGTRSVGRSVGLARTKAPAEGTFIMYSAGIGQEALDRLSDDDKNPNSIFTRNLLPLLKAPGLDITQMTKGLRIDVRDLALKAAAPHQNHKQFPAYYDQMEGNFYFVPGSEGKTTKIIERQNGADETLWKTIENSKKASDFEFYLSEHPKGRYSSLVKLKIKQLKETKVAIGIYPKKKPFTRSSKPGDTFKDCDDCPEMVVVPAGEFMMGSKEDEQSRQDDEGPRRKVKIQNIFSVGKFEVKFHEWDACVKDGGCLTYLPSDQGWGRLNRPVINVSWEDADLFVSWLSRKTGKIYRLLTEAEWEYVARAQTQTPFWWGHTISTYQANYNGNYSYIGSVGKYRKKTVPVDSFVPNAFGLYNVHGNVLEWVEGCWDNNYLGAPKDGTVENHLGDCSKRILRGGSWFHPPNYLRSAQRLMAEKDYRHESIGFRVARTLKE